MLAAAHWADWADRRDDLLQLAHVLHPDADLPDAPNRAHMTAVLAGQDPTPVEAPPPDLRAVRLRQLEQAAERGELDDAGHAELEGIR